MSNRLKTFFTDLANVYREASGSTDKIVANTLPTLFDELLKNGVGGGDSELIAYVTFMSEDGSTELFKMPVLKGDNCKDPVEHGDIEAPTKESTAQYDYTYSGWSNTSGGSANTNVLNNITEDKVVYVSYTSEVRYYNQYFYYNDELLETLSVPYGTTPNPSTPPAMTGYTFTGWSPALKSVTGEETYYAQYESVPMIEDSWATISANIKNGTYKDLYSIGQVKEITISDYNGVFHNMLVEIIAFDHDCVYDSGSYVYPPSITWLTVKTIALSGNLGGTSLSISDTALNVQAWQNTGTNNVRVQLQNKTLKELDTDLQDILLSKRTSSNNWKGEYTKTNCKLWIPSAEEIGSTISEHLNEYDTPYSERFTNDASRMKAKVGSSDTPTFWHTKTAYGSYSTRVATVDTDGKFLAKDNNTSSTAGTGIIRTPVGFCIGGK